MPRMQARTRIAILVMAVGCSGVTSSGGSRSSDEDPDVRAGPAEAQPDPETGTGAAPAQPSPVGEPAAEPGEETASADDCRDDFEQLSQTPAHQHAPADYLQIADCFERAGLPGQQLQVLSHVVRLFPPQSAEVRTALRVSGDVYEKMGFLHRAADAYEQYGRRYGGQSDAGAVLRRAVCLQYILGLPSAEKNARTLASLTKRGRAEAYREPAELCPDALDLVTGAICRLRDHDRAETSEMAESLARRRSERFKQAYAAPEELCPDE
jgi:hypothetical protein